MQAMRHGDLALVPLKKLPEGLTEEKAKTIMTGSNDNPHTFDNGKLYFKDADEFVFGYLAAKNTTLCHKEHGKKVKGKLLRVAKIPDGIYELRKQCEFVNEEIMPVKD